MSLFSDTAGLFDLTGKTALVVGGSGALGAAAARALAGAGAHVGLSGANRSALSGVADALIGEGASAQAIIGRPDSEASADAIVAEAMERNGRLDIAVLASGTSIVKPALDMTPDELGSVLDANVRQSWLMARSAARAMIAAGDGGRIILISSVRASFASPAGTSAYGASKAAVDMMTRSFATEWGRHGITVNAIAPTIFRSPLTAWLFEEGAEDKRARSLARIPLGRLAEPEDFGGAVIFLASRAGGYVTGEILRIDGGFSAN